MLPTLDPDLLRTFVAVAELRSFTRAARRLHRTQSAVSMQIKRLEERLQLELLERDRNGIVPSVAGWTLLGYARRMLALHDEACARLGHHRIEGEVRLGCMEDWGTLLLPPLLARFAAGFPAIRVAMETGLTAAMPARLGASFDLVIAMHGAGEGGGQLLRAVRPVWAGGPAQDPVPTGPLALALHHEGCLFRRWAIEALSAAGRDWRLAFTSPSLAAVEAVAAEGLAVTVVKADLMPARLRPLGASQGLPPLPMAEIRLHRSSELSVAGQLLARHLEEALGEPSPELQRQIGAPLPGRP